MRSQSRCRRISTPSTSTISIKDWPKSRYKNLDYVLMLDVIEHLAAPETFVHSPA